MSCSKRAKTGLKRGISNKYDLDSAKDIVMKSGGSSNRMNIGARLNQILMLNFARNNIVVLIDQGVVSVANFLTTLIIGRVCTKEEFGLYMLGFSIVIFIMNIQGFLISTPYTIYSPHLKEGDLARYSGSTLVHQLTFSMLVVLFLIIFAVFLFFGYGPPGLFDIVKTLIFAVSFMLLWDYARRFCLAALRTKTTLYLDCSVVILQVGGIFLLKSFASAVCLQCLFGNRRRLWLFFIVLVVLEEEGICFGLQSGNFRSEAQHVDGPVDLCKRFIVEPQHVYIPMAPGQLSRDSLHGRVGSLLEHREFIQSDLHGSAKRSRPENRPRPCQGRFRSLIPVFPTDCKDLRGGGSTILHCILVLGGTLAYPPVRRQIYGQWVNCFNIRA